LDPDFATNQQFYLFYTPAGAEEKQRLSRFTLIDNEVDPASERILLEVPITRSQCCHAAGSMAFDAEGNLFIALGDDTNPFDSDGYAPIDERSGRAPWDAQRSAGNTNDLRGAILRITPQPDGTYTIPAGNLFPNSAAGRPEIYAMGLRNPFRITVDTETGWLYWGDVGPDAQRASTSRGSEGLDEWNQARGPGNFGWPYCIGPNRAYREYDFGSGTAGPAFDCAAPTNNSPNNTGRATLPAAQPAWIWYPYGFSQDFPQLLGGSGRTAMAGPVYHYDAELSSAIKLPAYYDDTLFIYEWSRNWMMEVKLDDQGDILELNPFVPELELKRPISMRLGPDGALYVLEWGSGFGGDNQDARLVRIGYQGGPRAPVAVIDAAPTAGPVPLTVTFSAAGSYVPDSERTVDAQWDFEADGVVDATGFEVQHTYTETGTYTAQLIVTDDGGGQGVANVTITAGNTPPTVSLHAPVDGGFFEWGDGIPFGIAASDPEDGSTAVGTINCADLTFQLYVGHDDHSHPNHPLHTCTGTLQTPDGHGGEGDNIFLVVEAIYTDEGAPGTDALTTQVQHLLHPRRIQAEHFSTNEGTVPETTGDTAGGARNLGFIDDGDHISFDRMNLTDIGFVTYRVASAGPGGRIEVHVDARDGPLISTAYVEPTGQWQVYRDVTTPINDPSGTHDLFFVFKSDLGTTGLFNLNWIDFHGPGVADRTLRGDGGLTAIYFSTPDFSGPGITRIDPQVNFNWRTDAPLVSLPADHFSVRWTGQVKAAFDEAYTFHVRSRDAMRMWLGDQLLIDFAGASSVEEVSSAPVALAAGQRYDVMVEVAHTTGEAQVHLVWSSASMPKAIVPARLLYPDAETGTATDTSPVIPDQLRLDPAFPNPFTEATTFTVDLPTGGHVQLEMFDVTGRRVALLEDGMRGAGRYAVRFSPEGLPSGVYLCRLTTPVGIRTQQIVMVR
ncbi:MAG TPA: carbohydrate-binding protein, partial [Rhodothermales bacterium]|nr:carbohydrate-binding protein [Rhodothermales bacterium]